MKVLVTGGCGFIGTNIVRRHVAKGDTVIIIDNLSRKGSDKNKDWAKENGCEVFVANIESGISDLVLSKHKDVDIVYHMAAQVAVTTSIKEPLHDAQVNIYGTLRLLESVRGNCPKAFFIYASTNKVYGALDSGPLAETETRYTGLYGVDENVRVDFHSPYGCSKGAADQYVRDYARICGLKTVVFRQSCIYGDHQSGMEDQGWLSWFCQKALRGEVITIYGDGKQVRDILYIDDLLDLFDVAYQKQDICSGQIYNIGGGVENTISLLELIDVLSALDIPRDEVAWINKDWRDGDQKVYISDIGKAKRDFGWEPKVSPKEGVLRLYEYTKGIV